MCVYQKTIDRQYHLVRSSKNTVEAPLATRVCVVCVCAEGVSVRRVCVIDGSGT